MCGNYGLHAGMAIIVEIHEIKRAHNNIVFKWIKGHQENASCCQNPEIYLNNKCDAISNIEREASAMN